MNYGKAAVVLLVIVLSALMLMGNLMAGMYLIALVLAICAGGGFRDDNEPVNPSEPAFRAHAGPCAECDEPHEWDGSYLEEEVLGQQDYSKY